MSRGNRRKWTSTPSSPACRSSWTASAAPSCRSSPMDAAHHPELGCKIEVRESDQLDQWHNSCRRERWYSNNVIVNFHGQVVAFDYHPISEHRPPLPRGPDRRADRHPADAPGQDAPGGERGLQAAPGGHRAGGLPLHPAPRRTRAARTRNSSGPRSWASPCPRPSRRLPLA